MERNRREGYEFITKPSHYRDFEAGDNQPLKFKWWGRESNPGPLALQAKSLTTTPPLLPICIENYVFDSILSEPHMIWNTRFSILGMQVLKHKCYLFAKTQKLSVFEL